MLRTEWANGNLLVAGGDFSNGHQPFKTYRFPPRALNPAGPTDPAAPCTPGTITGNPWTELQNMTIGRYYPTLVGSPKETIDPGPDAIAGGSTIVLGGAPTAANNQEDGNEWWQLMAAAPNTNWSRTFYPDPHPDATHGVPPGANEMYIRKSLLDPSDPNYPASLPKVKLDSYPKSYFLSNIGADPNWFKHNLFMACDLDTRTNEGPSIAGTQGDSAILRLVYGGTMVDEFQMWRGPDADVGTSNNDHQYGGAAFMHMKAGSEFSNGKNRLLLFGGMQDNTPSGATRSWSVTQPVQEFRPGSNPVSGTYQGTGVWITKNTGLQTPRLFNNPVIDPLGNIIIIGGSTSVTASDAGPIGFEPRPEIYFPGDAGGPTGASSAMMSAKPNAPGASQPFARLYHNWALLLPDGRIMNGGGGWDGNGPDCRFSAEIFSPPYLSYLNRPQIYSIQTIAGSDIENIDFSTSPSSPSQFVVTVDHINSTLRHIDSVVLLRPAAVTHNFDADQRYIELKFISQGWVSAGEKLLVDAPVDDLGPPGCYMLFVVEKNDYAEWPAPQRGPSSGKFIKLF